VRAGWLIGVAACLALVSCQDDVSSSGTAPMTTPSRVPEVDSRTAAPVQPPAVPSAVRAAGLPLLHAARGGDGDSWKDTRGVEYRLGLVNTPELSECYGEIASHKRKQLTAAGFRATSYTVDQYRRHVSVVYLADGRNLNVWLARNGYANDRYLKEFRHENQALAAQLDPAFAAAKREHLGLWGACGSAQPQGFAAQAAASPAARGNCDAAYPDVCIPPPPPAHDGGDITYRRFRVLAPDPHHFDADGNGIGCESG
jgi:endonuclease YncB( thermonuclease family)